MTEIEIKEIREAISAADDAIRQVESIKMELQNRLRG